MQVLDAVGGRGCAELSEHAAHDRVEQGRSVLDPELVQVVLELAEQRVEVRTGRVEAVHCDVVVLDHLARTSLLCLACLAASAFAAGRAAALEHRHDAFGATLTHGHELDRVPVERPPFLDAVEDHASQLAGQPLEQPFFADPPVGELLGELGVQTGQQADDQSGQHLSGAGRVRLPGSLDEHDATLDAVPHRVVAAAERSLVLSGLSCELVRDLVRGRPRHCWLGGHNHDLASFGPDPEGQLHASVDRFVSDLSGAGEADVYRHGVFAFSSCIGRLV